jgi:hypothetical protein
MRTTVNPRLPLFNEPLSGPTYAVWELTLRCNQACRFCGTRAGRARSDELDTAEALEVIRQLQELGVREVALHGGEAYLRPDWLELVRAIGARGMSATLVTGGRGLTADLAQQAQGAGITAVSVSLDGLRDTHDWLRGIEGSHAGAREALRHLEQAGVPVGANTQGRLPMARPSVAKGANLQGATSGQPSTEGASSARDTLPRSRGGVAGTSGGAPYAGVLGSTGVHPTQRCPAMRERRERRGRRPEGALDRREPTILGDVFS